MDKRCKSCDTTKPLSDFMPEKRNCDGRMGRCRACELDRMRRNWPKYHAQHERKRQERIKKFKAGGYVTVAEKVCADCKQLKPTADYGRMEASPDGLLPRCRSCAAARCREWDKRNPEKKKSGTDAWNAANREVVRRIKNKWKAANPEELRQYKRAREARIRNSLIGRFRYADILNRDGYVCHICGGYVHPDDLEFDHIIPISRGGPHSFDNVAVSHGECNRRKASKLISA